MRPLRVGMSVLLVTIVTGCASSRAVVSPAAGDWHGSAWALCTDIVQGFENLRFTLTDDGRWTAVIGARRAAGTLRLARGFVIFDGAVIGQPLVPVYYRLVTAEDGTLYGLTLLSSPPGRGTSPAMLDLRRVR